MGEQSFWVKVKSLIGRTAFKVFLWSINTSPEEYWMEVYEIEKAREEDDG